MISSPKHPISQLDISDLTISLLVHDWVFRRELHANTIYTMSLICGRIVTLALKYMAQMATAIRAYDFCALHAQGVIGMACYCAWDVVKVCWPSAARLELVLCRVQRCVAGSASVDATLRHVFVKFAGVGGFGSLMSEDAELLCWRVKRGSGIGEFRGTYLWRAPLATRRPSSELGKTSSGRNSS